MTKPNYTRTEIVKCTREKAFQAISKELVSWWGKVDNSDLSQLGDVFSVFFPGETEWRFELSKFTLNEAMHWKNIKADHRAKEVNHYEQEWLHTEVRWTLHDHADGVEIKLEHIGLTSELQCSDICFAGWDFFIGTSLKTYLETGVGSPEI